MTNVENQLLQERSDQSEGDIIKSKTTIILLTLFACIIVLILVVYYSRIIVGPISKLAIIAEKIAAGNLVNIIETTTRKDEIGVLVRAIKLMSENLLAQITDISDGVNVLSSSASEIMASVSQLASGSAETATSVSETSATISEVKQTAEVSNQKAIKISESSKINMDVSKSGMKSIDETIEGMNRVKVQMASIADIVIRLSEQSQSIGAIVNSVNDLAEQSNLLAVNASIEAAKAGEHGRGFGVVAQEIKNLASRSKEATSQIKLILSEIQKSISNTVMATEQGGKAVDEGLKLSEVAGNVINTLSDSVNESAQAAFQIASSSQQQLVGMDQINEAMEGIKEASIQTAASTRQSEESVTDLHRLGEKLQNILKKYKLE
ncbi:MAG: methyl-accepting chemotaxis protein [Salinivirgaceae bacterium]|nr:methyl-accepting chemotaxis protein [Salinivirgaceae bacterium]